MVVHPKCTKHRVVLGGTEGNVKERDRGRLMYGKQSNKMPQDDLKKKINNERGD